MGPSLQYNAAPLPSAPSPVLFSFGGGVRFNILSFLTFQPHAQFFATYYLLQDGNALPASPENRTAYVPSMLLDLPFIFTIPVKNTEFNAGLGLAFFMRAAFLASKVPSSEQEDVDAMNSYFWSGLRFFYPSINLGWDFTLSRETSCGLFAKLFFPLGNFSDDAYSLAQDGIMILGAKISFNILPKDKAKEEAKAQASENKNPEKIESQE
ncbi:MAG: hypothetical protein K5839_01120 [Treponemataceae bacterium]|nr:hypothetical protein [Treponemataceae bacterium]